MEKKKDNSMQLRKMTFFPPFILLLLIVTVSYTHLTLPTKA